MEEQFEVESRHEAGEESFAAGPGRWLINAIAVTTAVLAVGAALSSLLAGRAAHHSLAQLNEAAIAQNLASDQWNYYQAKGIKAYVYLVQRDALRLQGGPKATRQAAAYDKEVTRYNAEQAQIAKDAKARERERDEAKSAAQRFDDRYQRLSLAVTAFQVAIVISSVAAIVRRPWLWYLGLAGGVLGLIFLGQELFPAAGGRAA